MLKSGFICILAVLAVTSCEKVQKVEDFPVHNSKLVTNCFLRADSPFVFFVSKSLSPLDNAPFRNMLSPSAFIRVFENNILYDSFRAGTRNFRGSKMPRAGNAYRFECSYPGFGIVSAEDYLPDTLQVTGKMGSRIALSTKTVNDSVVFTRRKYHLDLKLRSTNPSGDYVMVTIFNVTGRDSATGILYQRIISATETSRMLDNETQGVYMKFPYNGKPIEALNFEWEGSKYIFKGMETDRYRIQILVCTKNTYEYIKRFQVQYQNLNDPFAQPVGITNNIVNGYGIFGGLAEQNVFVDF